MEGITMKEGIMIGDLCRLAECTPRTIRHYEAEGLLAPISQTAGSRKLYDKETVSLVRTIRLLKRLGYSLKDIRSIISLTKSTDTKHRRLTKRLRKILEESLSSIELELQLLADSRENIAALIEKTDKCKSCESKDCKDCGKLKSLRTLGLLQV